MKNIKFAILILVAMSLLLSGCKKDEEEAIIEPEPQEKEFILGYHTKTMDFDARTAITDLDTSDFSLSISSSSSFLNSLAVGDIIVDSTSSKAPNGYMRKITAIESDGGTKIIRTEQALLYEAIKQASIRFKTGDLKMSDIRSLELAPGIKLKEASGDRFRAFSFDFDHQFGTSENGVNISGESYFDLEFFWDFDWSLTLDMPPFEVDLLEAGIEFNQGGSINVEGNGNFDDNLEFRFAAIEFTPWTIMAGPVPLVFTPTIEFFINVKGEISAHITTGASETFDNRFGIKYENEGWSTIGESDFDKTFIVPSVEANASIETSIGPRASLLLYGVAGPTIGIKAYSNLEAELLANQNFNMDFDLGIKGTAGVVLTVFGFDILNEEREIFDYPINLYHIEDGSTEESISITSPIPNAQIAIGNTSIIDVYTSGSQPQKVEFYVNEVLIGEDIEEPFNYEWNTSDLSADTYILKAKAIYADHELESEPVSVNVVLAGWDVYNLKDHISGLPDYMALSDIFLLDDSHIWVRADEGEIFFSSNAGDSWSWINKNEVKYMSDPVYLSANDGYGFGSSYNFLYTNDGGATWMDNQPIQSFLGESVVINHSESTPLVMYGRVGGEEVMAFYSTDQFMVETYLYFSDYNVATSYQDGYVPNPEIVSNGGTIFIPNMKYDGSEEKHLGIYKNGGFNLVDIGLSSEDLIVDLFFLNDVEGWIVSSLNLLFRTTDGGNTWEQIFNGSDMLGGYEVKLFFTDAYTGYWIETYFGVQKPKLYKTINGGINWEPVDGFTRLEGLADIEFYGSNLGFIVGGSITDDNGYKIHRYREGK
ncbi:Ig-like domain-containing protein [Lentimicrobium sp. S6]|uniref:Ig-like domain-containing protein n=1 Tax=Lentimicrobium sp. S6 TaxID=2735872 RepID=UPI0015518904|nr:Ig-like domain-containing protein [Lentimicrobium sp. S6]NPD47997.1 hypothetical protein [Lentimicrobium sp. S6]